jgi:hypothetical protein
MLKPRRPSPATAISLVALFVALGGTSYAVATIGSAQVKNNSLTSSDIKNNTVGSTDVKNNSLLAKDFKAGQLVAGAPGAAGPTGPQGPKGDTGATGPQGPADGPAGGDLTGNYPNPTIADGAVGSSKVADNSLTGGDINESSLGTVPNSDTVDGNDARSFRFYAPVSTASTQALTLGGLTINATCDAAGDLDVTASTSRSNANIDVTGGTADDDFDTGDTFNVLQASDDEVAGVLTYATSFSIISGGAITSVTFLAEEEASASPACVFAGTALGASSSGISIGPILP